MHETEEACITFGVRASAVVLCNNTIQRESVAAEVCMFNQLQGCSYACLCCDTMLLRALQVGRKKQAIGVLTGCPIFLSVRLSQAWILPTSHLLMLHTFGSIRTSPCQYLTLAQIGSVLGNVQVTKLRTKVCGQRRVTLVFAS